MISDKHREEIEKDVERLMLFILDKRKFRVDEFFDRLAESNSLVTLAVQQLIETRAAFCTHPPGEQCGYEDLDTTLRTAVIEKLASELYDFRKRLAALEKLQVVKRGTEL